MAQFLNHEDIDEVITQNLNDEVIYNNVFGFSTIGVRIKVPTDGEITFEGSYDGISWFRVQLKEIQTKKYLNVLDHDCHLSGTITGIKQIKFRVSKAGSAAGSVVGRSQIQQSVLSGIEKVNVDYQSGALTTRPPSDLLDSFGRSRVVEPLVLFESAMTYNKRPQLFQEKISGTGTVTHLTNRSMVEMTVGTTEGDRVIRQTRRYFRYQVARTHYKTYVGVLGEPKAGVESRVGGYDNNDGFFFKQTETGLSVVRRDSTSGSVVDDVKPQAEWNIDRLDGTGPSRITLDPTKLIIYGDKFNYHGGGPTTLGIYLNGRFNPCHTFAVNNEESDPIISLPNVPIRYEIINTGTSNSGTSVFQGASSCVIDGGLEIDQSLSFSANNGISTRTMSTSTPIPVIAIRPKTTFEGRVNRTSLVPVSFDVQASDGVLVEVHIGGTITGGGNWASASNESTAEVKRDGTAITGGRVLSSTYIPATKGSSQSKIDGEILEDLFLTLDIDGNNPEVLALVVRSLSGSPTALASINWRESY